jgi:serine/threonine protein phosphatase PrpC
VASTGVISAATSQQGLALTEISFAQKTDPGRVRDYNQDSVLAVGPGDIAEDIDGLFIVADGMSSPAGGEVASRITVETLPAALREALSANPEPNDPRSLADAMRVAMRAANDAVSKHSRANPELKGMGTTCIAVALHQDVAVIGNVGDSRLYLLRNGELTQKSHDHVFVQAIGQKGAFGNVVTRGIGLSGMVEVDVELMRLHPGDTLLLCSDGLTDLVSNAEIARLLGSSPDVQAVTDSLVETANENGGVDNISTVVVRYGPYVQPVPAAVHDNGTKAAVTVKESPTPARSRRRKKDWNAVFTYLFVLLCVVVGAAFFLVNSERYSFNMQWPFFHEKPAKNAPAPAPDSSSDQ